MKRNHYAAFSRTGNIKLGNIASFSKLYSDEYIETVFGLVLGSCRSEFCSGCKGSCYVRKSYRYPSVRKGHARNTLAIRESLPESFEELRLQISRARKPFTDIRIHQSGEFESTAEFLAWCKLARQFPTVKFFVYTKAFCFVIPALLAGRVPDNLTVNLSIWHEYGIKEYMLVRHLPNVKAFVYMDGFDYTAYGLEIETLCMAYDEHGKLNHEITCERCRKCIDRACRIVGCYDHS